MGSNNNKVFSPRIMLAMLLAMSATLAQDEDLLDLAVDTAAAERDESEPRVSSTVLAADVIREQSGGQVMDRLELRRAEITGNQELPKVLYIVPWKKSEKSDPGDLMGRPVNTLLDEILAPLDREEFIRRVGYYGDLYGEKDE